MGRRAARVAAVQYIYSLNFNPSMGFDEFVDMTGAPKKECDIDFCKRLIECVESRRNELNALLSRHIVPKSKQTPMVERSILEVGLCEMLYVGDAEEKVVINEYIEVAKSLGEEGAKAFVNAVLDAVRREYEGKADSSA